MEHDTKADARFSPVEHSRTFRRALRVLGLGQKRVLDLGCSYGEYLVHFGKGSVGVTSTEDEVRYGREHSLSIVRGNVEQLHLLRLEGQFEAIWANNLFEHLTAPHAFLMHLKSLAKDDTLLILGVPVIPRLVSLMRIGKFRGALASPHINFYTRETLAHSVARAGWRVECVRPFVFSSLFLDWLFSFIAPHLYVVAHNDPNFVYPEKKIKEWKGEPFYEELLHLGGVGGEKVKTAQSDSAQT